jgi:hypothetical protein
MIVICSVEMGRVVSEGMLKSNSQSHLFSAEMRLFDPFFAPRPCGQNRTEQNQTKQMIMMKMKKMVNEFRNGWEEGEREREREVTYPPKSS